MKSLDEVIAEKLAAIGIDKDVQFTEIPVETSEPFNPYLHVTCPTCGGLLVQREEQYTEPQPGGFWPEQAICEDCGQLLAFVIFSATFPVFELKEQTTLGRITIETVPTDQTVTELYVYMFRWQEDGESETE